MNMASALQEAKNNLKKKILQMDIPFVDRYLEERWNPQPPEAQMGRAEVAARILGQLKWGSMSPQDASQNLTRLARLSDNEKASVIANWVQQGVLDADRGNVMLNYPNTVYSFPQPSPTPTPSPTSSLPGTRVPSQPLRSYEDFKKIAVPILKQYGIPPAVGLGQFAAEGRLNSRGAQNNNFYNIGAFDSNPSAAQTYSTPEEGITAYAKLLSGQFKLPSGTTDNRYLPAFELRNDPVAMIKKIQDLGYAGDPKTYSQRSDSGFRSYADFVMATPEFASFAN